MDVTRECWVGLKAPQRQLGHPLAVKCRILAVEAPTSYQSASLSKRTAINRTTTALASRGALLAAKGEAGEHGVHNAWTRATAEFAADARPAGRGRAMRRGHIPLVARAMSPAHNFPASDRDSNLSAVEGVCPLTLARG